MATSAAVEAIAARLGAAHAAAAPAIAAVVPPAIDPVSLQAAAEFSEQGAQHTEAVAKGVEVLGRAGIGVGAAATNYATGDAAAAAAYLPTVG